MDTDALFSFPLPMLTSVLCTAISVLVWRLNLGPRRTSTLFSLVFALGAIQSFLVGLRFGYGIEGFSPVQRVLPLFLGPVIYLGFISLMFESQQLAAKIVWHLFAPVVALGCFWFLVNDLRALDWLISASYLFYVIALVTLWRSGPDRMIFAPVNLVSSLSNWVLRGSGLLIFLLVLDTVIALDFAFAQGRNVTWLISFGTIPLVLILLVLLATLPRLLPLPPAPSRAAQSEEKTDHSHVMAALNSIMVEDRLYLDPALTVQRLAKRLHIPARQVSAAVNDTKDMNVSQYVNELRLAHAAALLKESGGSVKSVAEASGFLSRSNFYREFQRVYGMSPSDYRTSAS